MMRRNFILYCCMTAVLVGSCNKMGSHLPPKKMEQVLLDISIAESFSSFTKDRHFGGPKNQDSLAHYYAAIFQHHHITEQEFKESMAWYKNHPDEMDTVYTDLAVKADKMLAAESNKKKK